MSDDLTTVYNLGYTCAKDMARDEIERLRAENEKLRNEVMSDYHEGWEEGVKAERERCAKIVLEKVALPAWIDEMEDERFADAAYDFADAAAAAIRETKAPSKHIG